MKMSGGAKGLLAGLVIGVVATLFISHFIDRHTGIPEQLAEGLGCSDGADGIHTANAADAHRFGNSHKFSWFAAIKAERILYVNGCDPVGSGVSYLEFGSAMNMGHVLATLDTFGAVCQVEQSIFDGKLLNGRGQLEELCGDVGGDLRVLHPAKRQ